MEQKKKKSHVEEGVNADDSEDEKETTSDVSIPTDTDGPGIYPYTKVIIPDMVLTYEYDDDSNNDNGSNISYEPKDDDDDVLVAKELPVGTSIYYASPEANILLATRLVQTSYDSIVEQISICDAVHYMINYF